MLLNSRDLFLPVIYSYLRIQIHLLRFCFLPFHRIFWYFPMHGQSLSNVGFCLNLNKLLFGFENICHMYVSKNSNQIFLLYRLWNKWEVQIRYMILYPGFSFNGRRHSLFDLWFFFHPHLNTKQINFLPYHRKNKYLQKDEQRSQKQLYYFDSKSSNYSWIFFNQQRSKIFLRNKMNLLFDNFLNYLWLNKISNFN